MCARSVHIGLTSGLCVGLIWCSSLGRDKEDMCISPSKGLFLSHKTNKVWLLSVAWRSKGLLESDSH